MNISCAGTGGATSLPNKTASLPPLVPHHATPMAALSTSISPLTSTSQNRRLTTSLSAALTMSFSAPATSVIHSSKMPTLRNGSESTSVSTRVLCSETISPPASPSPAAGGSGAVAAAWCARKRTISSRVSASSGCRALMAKGGERICMTVLKAKRNWRGEMWPGNAAKRVSA